MKLSCRGPLRGSLSSRHFCTNRSNIAIPNSILLRQKIRNPRRLETVVKDAGVPACLQKLLLPLLQPFVRGMVSSEEVNTRQMEKRIRAGLGDYTETEFNFFLTKDLNTFQSAVGKKKFVFGDKLSSVCIFLSDHASG